MSKEKEFIVSLLKKANADKDIRVLDERVYARIIAKGSLGLGESYMDGWWECDDLAEFFNKILRARINKQFRYTFDTAVLYFQSLLSNRQSKARALVVGEKHYDIGNDLYEAMLGQDMVYTCGYWQNATNLKEAQDAKLKLIFDKVHLQKDETLLDIGCGWGTAMKYAEENYGAKTTGLTISKEQKELAQKRVKGDIQLKDYRDMTGTFDKVISIGMFEHVGKKNYSAYMKAAHSLLADNGLFVLHTIGGENSSSKEDPWLDKYIFPNSVVPSLADIIKASEPYFVVHDVENFGPYYDKTLCVWYENFKASWPKFKDIYGERFYRMWTYYLLMCAGTFRARQNQLYHVVFSKRGYPAVYKRP